MPRIHLIIRAGTLLATLLLLSAPVRGDFLPSPAHAGLPVHLDPFAVGWTLPPPPAAVAPGTVVPMGAPDNDLVGSLAIDGKAGFDALLSAGGWHWEIELDLDPYGVLGAAIPVTIVPLGGPALAPILVPLVAGPDLYFDIHQPDDVEIGAFTKWLVNLTPFAVGWGTSVVEDLVGPPPDHIAKTVCHRAPPTPGTPDDPSLPPDWGADCLPSIIEPLGTHPVNALALALSADGGFVIEQRFVPEPGALVLLLAGLAFVLSTSRGREPRRG